MKHGVREDFLLWRAFDWSVCGQAMGNSVLAALRSVMFVLRLDIRIIMALLADCLGSIWIERRSVYGDDGSLDARISTTTSNFGSVYTFGADGCLFACLLVWGARRVEISCFYDLET